MVLLGKRSEENKFISVNALCEEKGIKLIRIPYTNLENINSILTNILLGE